MTSQSSASITKHRRAPLRRLAHATIQPPQSRAHRMRRTTWPIRTHRSQPPLGSRVRTTCTCSLAKRNERSVGRVVPTCVDGGSLMLHCGQRAHSPLPEHGPGARVTTLACGWSVEFARCFDVFVAEVLKSQKNKFTFPFPAIIPPSLASRASLGLCAQATTLSSQVFGKGNLRSRAGRPSV